MSPSNAVTFHVNVSRHNDGVLVELITPDGEIEPIGLIENPMQVMGFAVTFGAMMCSMVTQAVYEARA